MKEPYDWAHMARSDITAALGRMLIMDVFRYPDPRIYWADEVTYDYTLADPIRVDFMRFKRRRNARTSRSDSQADQALRHRSDDGRRIRRPPTR